MERGAASGRPLTFLELYGAAHARAGISFRMARLPAEPTATIRTILQGWAPFNFSTNEPREPALERHCRPAADTRTLSRERKPCP